MCNSAHRHNWGLSRHKIKGAESWNYGKFCCFGNAIWSRVQMIVTRIRNGWSKFRDLVTLTAQKMKFSIKDFFSKCDQMRRKLRIWPHLLKKSLMENFIFFVQCLLASNGLLNGVKVQCYAILKWDLTPSRGRFDQTR